jgi:hypothetical protein
MGIKIGNNNIAKAYIGSTEILKMYLGDILILNNSDVGPNKMSIISVELTEDITPPAKMFIESVTFSN